MCPDAVRFVLNVHVNHVLGDFWASLFYRFTGLILNTTASPHSVDLLGSISSGSDFLLGAKY